MNLTNLMNLDLCGDSYGEMQDKIANWQEARKNYGISTQIAHITKGSEVKGQFIYSEKATKHRKIFILLLTGSGNTLDKVR